MTKPEVFTNSQNAIHRAHTSGVQSMYMHQAGQRAIEETKKLLREITCNAIDPKGRTE